MQKCEWKAAVGHGDDCLRHREDHHIYRWQVHDAVAAVAGEHLGQLFANVYDFQGSYDAQTVL